MILNYFYFILKYKDLKTIDFLIPKAYVTKVSLAIILYPCEQWENVMQAALALCTLSIRI